MKRKKPYSKRYQRRMLAKFTHDPATGQIVGPVIDWDRMEPGSYAGIPATSEATGLCATCGRRAPLEPWTNLDGTEMLCTNCRGHAQDERDYLREEE